MKRKVITKAQQKAVLRLWKRDKQSAKERGRELKSYKQFRKTAHWSHTNDCLMIPFAGMWVGIEKDGYTHS